MIQNVRHVRLALDVEHLARTVELDLERHVVTLRRFGVKVGGVLNLGNVADVGKLFFSFVIDA